MGFSLVVRSTMRLQTEHRIGVSLTFCRAPSVRKKRVTKFLVRQSLLAGFPTVTALLSTSLSLTSHHDEFIRRVQSPPNRARIFHFSSQSVAKLKRMANSDCKTLDISSFQAVSALIWRCITRARSVPRDQETSCSMAADNRTRMDPPLPNVYFGNAVQLVKGKASAGELLEHGLGWAAWLLHEAVLGHSAGAVREYVEKWIEHPFMYVNGKFSEFGVTMGWSTRFRMYECEFGMGRAVAIRSGYDARFDGKVTFYPGREGGGSMDVEVCLLPEAMFALESDGEFMDAVNGK